MSEEEFKAKYEELKSNPMYQQYCAMIDTKNKIIDKLQQENQQLRNALEKLKDSAGWREILELSGIIQERDKYKEVIEEVREYINNYDVFKEFSFPLMKRDEENQIKSSIKYEFDTSIKKELLQIVDKV